MLGRIVVLCLSLLFLAAAAFLGWDAWLRPQASDAWLEPAAEPAVATANARTTGPHVDEADEQAAEATARMLVQDVTQDSGAQPIRVLTEAEFFRRLQELGIHPSRSMFDEIHAQRADRGALLALTTDQDGQVVSDARVVVEAINRENLRHHVGSGEFSEKVQRRTTGRDGLALFENLMPAAYLLAAQHRDYVTQQLSSVQVSRGRPTFVEITLKGPDATITGSVRSERGLLLQGVLVTARRYMEGGAPFSSSFVTGYDGRFEVGVEGGTANLITAEKTGFESAHIEGVLAGTEDLRITLEGAPTVFVSGYVTKGTTSEPIPSFQVAGIAIQDPQGVFRIERNVSPDPQNLVFAARGYAPRTITLTLASDNDVDLGQVPLFGGKELDGIVLREEGESLLPVAGAQVAVVTETGAMASMRSTGAGAFSFRELAAERVRLSVTAAGFEEHARDIVLLPDKPTYVEVVLKKGEFQASGIITDEDSEEPLEGALVEVVERPDLSALTDATGAYHLAGIDRNEFTLRASKSGYRPATSPLLTGNTEGVTWDSPLTPSGLRIRFHLAGGPAPPGIAVVLWQAVEPNLGATLAAQASLATTRIADVTDEDGTVTFDVADGTYFVQVVDYRLHPTRVVSEQNNTEWIEIDLPGRSLLTGQIRNADGSPVANTSLWLHSGDQDYSTMFLYHTDAGGNYSIPNLAARPYALSIIKSPTVQSAQHVVEFFGSAAATQNLNVQFPPMSASISGRVTDENGVGKGGVHVGVEFLDAPHRSILAGWVLTGPDGSYSVPLLEPGRHRVRTAWTEDVAVFSDIVTLAANQQAQVDLVAPNVQGRHVRGHMIANDGGPLGGSFLFAIDAEGRQNGNFFSTMDWAYAGAFDIKGLAPGNYTIVLTAMGCRKQSISLNVTQDVQDLVVVMQRE